MFGFGCLYGRFFAIFVFFFLSETFYMSISCVHVYTQYRFIDILTRWNVKLSFAQNFRFYGFLSLILFCNILIFSFSIFIVFKQSTTTIFRWLASNFLLLNVLREKKNEETENCFCAVEKWIFAPTYVVNKQLQHQKQVFGQVGNILCGR